MIESTSSCEEEVLATEFGGVGRPSDNPSPAASASKNMPPWPDLLEFVGRFGAFSQISADAWREFDTAVAKRRAADVAQLRAEQVRNIEWLRATVWKPAARGREAGAR
jgi:hypothetical protein